MKKALKIVAVLTVLIALVVLISSVLLHVLLPPEKAKALVLKQLTGHLKREVQIGEVSVGVISGLDVSDLKISESPDFAHGTFISSEHFSVRLALIPLIYRDVVVRQIILRHPVFNVVRYADGKTFNFSDLLAPSPPGSNVKTASHPPASGLFEIPEANAAVPGAEETKESAPPFKLVISHAEIDSGVVHFIDRSPANQSVDIDPLDLKLGNVSMTTPFSVQTMLKAKARNVVLALKFIGEADLKTASFKIKNCTLSSGGSTITLDGKANQLKSNRPTVDLNLAIKEFKLATLSPFVSLPSAFKLEGPILGNAHIKGDQKKMSFSALIDLQKVQVKYANQFSKPAQVPMEVSVHGDLTDLQDVDLAELKTTLGSLQCVTHGKILAVNSAQPQVSLHVESNPFPVMELVGFAAASLPKDLAIKGRAQLAADISGTTTSSHFAAKCDGKDLGVTLGDNFAKPSGTPLHLSMEGELIQPPALPGKKAAAPKSQTINFQSLAAQLGTMELNGTGSAQTSGAATHFQMNLKSNTFSLQELSHLVPQLVVYHLTGTASTGVRASGTFEAPTANGVLNLQDVSLHYEQSDLTHLSSAIQFTQQDVSIPKLVGKLNGADLSMKLVGHRLTTQPDVNVDANITELNLSKLLPASEAPAPTPTQGWLPTLVATAWATPAPLPPMKLAGHLTVGHVMHEYYDARNLDFKWNLSEVTPDLSRVNGTANLKQGPGKLTNVDKLASQSKAARLALLPLTTLQKMDKGGVLKTLGIPSLQTINFDSIHGDYVFNAGVMNIKVFDLNGRDLNVSTLGTIGLAGAQPLDVRVTMKLAAGAGGGLGQFIADSSGRPALAFTAKGTVSNPQVRADLHEVERKAVQQVGQQLLKGLGLGGGQATPPPAAANDTQNAPTTPQQPSNPSPNPAEDLQKAFKSIFH